VERACVVLEALFPWGPLTTAYEADKPDCRVADRRQYLLDRLKHSAWLFSLANGRSSAIRPAADGWQPADDRHVQIAGRLTEVDNPVYELGVTFSTDSWAECERAFVSVGDAVQAYTAVVNPPEATADLRAFHAVMAGRSAHMSGADVGRAAKLNAALVAARRELPPIADPRLAGRADPAQPQELGWLNYWSAGTATFLGFPVRDRDGDLLASSYRTPAGAWLVKLCPEPLDLDRPEHLRIYSDIYARFPLLGVRATGKDVRAPVPTEYPWHTTFIQVENPWQVVEGLVPFLRGHGLKVVERIPEKVVGESLTLAVFPGAPGWSIAKTLPEAYLGQPLPGSGVPRLAALSEALGRPAFTLEIYDPIQASLIEADGRGRSRSAGFREGAAEEPSPIGFELLPIEVDMLDLDDCGQLAGKMEQELAGRNADLCDNRRFAAALDRGELQQRQGVLLRFVPI
jgi:hypothetical protein